MFLHWVISGIVPSWNRYAEQWRSNGLHDSESNKIKARAERENLKQQQKKKSKDD